MSRSELLMYGLVAACAAAYLLIPKAWELFQKVNPGSYPAPAPDLTGLPGDSAWRERWVTSLMRLQDELAEDGRELCVPLVRELIWRLMEGEPNDVPARPPASPPASSKK